MKGIKNLFDIYLPIVDGALIFDNSEGKHELTAEKQGDRLLNILNQDKFDYLRRYCDTIEIQIDEKNKILKGLEKV
ncbi:hypothetical protein [Niabella terrae]